MKAACVLLLLLICAPVRAAEMPASLHPTNPPRPLPPFVFEDDHGVQHALSDYRGRIVVLSIWATWCGPCVREMPSLDALQKNTDPRQLTVLPLSEDRGDAIVSGFYRSHSINHLPIAIDTAGNAQQAFVLHGLPTTLIIDAQGREIARAEGSVSWNAPEMREFLLAQRRTN